MLKNLSHTEENYLKAIFSLSNKSETAVSTNELAEKIVAKPSSVTDMVQKLAEKKLVDYKKYQGVYLTSNGRKTAVSIIRNHRLWEVFLVEKLDFKWDEVHDFAEQLEHIKSDTLIERLDAFLNFPTHDPHGDPIPDKNGNIAQNLREPLSNINIGSTCTLVGVNDSSSKFLKFLDKSKIKLGSTIKVLHKEEFDNSMHIQVDKNKLSISHQITKNLLVKII